MQALTLTKQYNSNNDALGATLSLSANELNTLSQLVPQNSTDVVYGFAFNGNQPTGTGTVPALVPSAGLVGLYIQSSQQITVKFYAGTSLLGTIALAANDPFEWHVNSPNANPCGTSTSGQLVTQIKVTTPATLPASADLEIRALSYV